MYTEALVMNKEANLKQIFDGMEGVTLREKRGGLFRYPLHLTQQMRETGIESLDLGQRSFNCLKRAGYDTIGELAEAIAAGKNLKNVRNCGTKSIREIMEKLFLYQYHTMRPEEREKYLAEVILHNAICVS